MEIIVSKNSSLVILLNHSNGKISYLRERWMANSHTPRAIQIGKFSTLSRERGKGGGGGGGETFKFYLILR